jgi:hypothetical protein
MVLSAANSLPGGGTPATLSQLHEGTIAWASTQPLLAVLQEANATLFFGNILTPRRDVADG